MHGETRIPTYCAVVSLCCALVLAGCITPSPRFGAKPKKTAEGGETKPKEPDSKKKPAGDKPGKQQPAETPPSGNDIPSEGKNFRKEKNPSIPPMDESKLMRQISRFMGTPYKLGGTDAAGLDCSGYTMTVYKNGLGLALPRSSAEQAGSGKPVSANELKFGDLVFFNTTGESASHVGIYLGDDLFAHASVGLGVTISALSSAYYRDRYEFARRVVQ